MHCNLVYNNFPSLFWQLLPKSQYLLSECGVTKTPFTLNIRELLANSDFCSAGVWPIPRDSVDAAVCVYTQTRV